MSFSDAVNQEDPHMLRSDEYEYKLFPVYHCGQFGLRNREHELQLKDWKESKNT